MAAFQDWHDALALRHTATFAQTVAVAFPRVDGGGYFVRDVDFAAAIPGEAAAPTNGLRKTIRVPVEADWAGDAEEDPENLDDLAAMAEAIARDYWAWKLCAYDLVLGGVAVPEPTGFDDAIVFDYGGQPDGTGSRLVVTRQRGMPLDVEPDQLGLLLGDALLSGRLWALTPPEGIQAATGVDPRVPGGPATCPVYAKAASGPGMVKRKRLDPGTDTLVDVTTRVHNPYRQAVLGSRLVRVERWENGLYYVANAECLVTTPELP